MLQKRAERGETPSALRNKPHLFYHLQWVREAYSHLATTRPPSMAGVLPIPWTAIDRYAERADINGQDDFEDFVSYIRSMDQTFLDFHEKKRKSEESKRQQKK